MSSSDLPRLWTTSSKFAEFVLSKSFFDIKNQTNLSEFFFSVKNIWLRDQLLYMKFFKNFDFWSTLFSKDVPNFFIILVVLTMTLFSEKMLISHRCICGLMLNLFKKSWTASQTFTEIKADHFQLTLWEDQCTYNRKYVHFAVFSVKLETFFTNWGQSYN